METKENNIATTIQHPYINTLLGTLNVHYERLERLRKRIFLIKENFASRSEFEKNEIELKIIETNSEIESLNKVVVAREDYFRNYMQKFAVDVKEMEENYETLLAKAKEVAVKKEEVSKFLASVQWHQVEENIEVKLKLYERLNKLIGK